MSELYKNIIALCEEKGVSPGKMATEIGISRSTITELGKGRSKSMTLDKAQKIADYFGVSLEALTGQEPPPPLPIAPEIATFTRAIGIKDLNLESFTEDDIDDIANFMKMIQKRREQRQKTPPRKDADNG